MCWHMPPIVHKMLSELIHIAAFWNLFEQENNSFSIFRVIALHDAPSLKIPV